LSKSRSTPDLDFVGGALGVALAPDLVALGLLVFGRGADDRLLRAVLVEFALCLADVHAFGDRLVGSDLASVRQYALEDARIGRLGRLACPQGRKAAKHG
jgi:hypothetical protein